MMLKLNRLEDKTFFAQNAIIVAKELIGKYLIRIINGKKIICKIVETEAYDGPEDDANHAFNNKRTSRNETLFWSGGIVHIFLIYGMYYCFNVVTDVDDYPSAVLIRAGEIISDERELNFISKFSFANGPGKLTRYLKIDKTFDGINLLTNDELYLCKDNNESNNEIIITSRVNVEYATNYKLKPYRFYLKNNKSVSKK